MPMFFLFFEQVGLSVKEIFLVQTVYNMAAFLMEVPSGYVGDRLTRKFSLLLGSFLAAMGFLTYYFTDSFWFFCAAAFLMGTGTSFISGSDSAMLFDTLLEIDREEDYLKYEGRVSAFGNFAEASAALIGGLIATLISIRTNLLVQGLLLLFAFLLILTTREPSMVSKHERKSFVDALSFIFKEMKKNLRFRHIMLFSSFMGVNTLCFAWVVQPYLKLSLGWTVKENIPFKELMSSGVEDWTKNGVAWILSWMALNLVVGIFAMNASVINRWFNKKTLVIILCASLVLPYAMIVKGNWMIICIGFFIFYAARGVVTPLFREWINQSVTSEIRATALSVRAFMFRILFAALGPIIGYSIDLYSIELALLGLGIVFFFMTIPYIAYTFRK